MCRRCVREVCMCERERELCEVCVGGVCVRELCEREREVCKMCVTEVCVRKVCEVGGGGVCGLVGGVCEMCV